MHAFPSCTLLILKKSTYMEENGGCFEHAGIYSIQIHGTNFTPIFAPKQLLWENQANNLV